MELLAEFEVSPTVLQRVLAQGRHAPLPLSTVEDLGRARIPVSSLQISRITLPMVANYCRNGLSWSSGGLERGDGLFSTEEVVNWRDEIRVGPVRDSLGADTIRVVVPIGYDTHGVGLWCLFDFVDLGGGFRWSCRGAVFLPYGQDLDSLTNRVARDCHIETAVDPLVEESDVRRSGSIAFAPADTPLSRLPAVLAELQRGADLPPLTEAPATTSEPAPE